MCLGALFLHWGSVYHPVEPSLGNQDLTDDQRLVSSKPELLVQWSSVGKLDLYGCTCTRSSHHSGNTGDH